VDQTELIEVRPPADAKTKSTSVALDWARRYPCEEVWRARKRRRLGEQLEIPPPEGDR
jgi:hypothetical protein